MELLHDTGAYIFRDIRAAVPAQTKEFPASGLKSDLHSIGMNAYQVGVVQERLRAFSTITTTMRADLITSREIGQLVNRMLGQDHPNWIEEGLSFEQGTVSNAIIEAVGAGWFVKGRLFLDGLVSDGRRIAVITGDGEIVDDQWRLCDLTGWRLPVEELVAELETTGEYGAIVANVRRNSRHPVPSPLTRGVPFFYLADKTPRVSKPKR